MKGTYCEDYLVRLDAALQEFKKFAIEQGLVKGVRDFRARVGYDTCLNEEDNLIITFVLLKEGMHHVARLHTDMYDASVYDKYSYKI